MMGLIITLHVIICILLIIIILIQPGRHGGLTEGMAAAESMFGAHTSSFMVKATSIFAFIFLVTCLGLAYFSTQKEKSLMPKRIILPSINTTQPADQPKVDAEPAQPAPDTNSIE